MEQVNEFVYLGNMMRTNVEIETFWVPWVPLLEI